MPEKYRIGLFLGMSPMSGGMFQYAQSILEAFNLFDKNKYTVLVAYSDKAWEPILATYKLNTIKVAYFSLGIFLANMSMALRIPASFSRVLNRYVNPLVHEMLALNCDCWVFPGQDALSYQMPTLSISTIHDLMHRYQPQFPEVSSKFRFGIREHRFRNIARDCAAVLVDSEIGKQQVIESYDVNEASIYSLPFVAPRYIQEETSTYNIAKQYGLPTKFLFYPAQFWLHKNHLLLLEALKLARETYPDLALVCSGGKRHAFLQIEQRARELGLFKYVSFVGYVPDAQLPSFYKSARALIMPTFFGPTNIPPLEAMALGCPVLISNLYGMPEQSGDAALYFEPSNVQEMAACIKKIWSDDVLAAELSNKGLARTKAKGPLLFKQGLEKVLEKVLEKRALAKEA